jgi:hypothetical protein
VPDEVTSQYKYAYCYLFNFEDGALVCAQEAIRTVYVSPLRPPFLYNNLCTSTILTSYIPVYVFEYAIQLLVSILLVTILTSIEYSSFPIWLQKGLHGVFWPNQQWIKDFIVPRDLLKATEIISFDILNHLAVFVTFGISSPFLAVILIFSVCLKLHLWRMIIGRFVYSRLSVRENICNIDRDNKESSRDDGIATLSIACLPIMEMLEHCIRPIVLSSAVFFAFICWDVAGDEVGWRASVWAPLTVLTIPLLLWCFVLAYHHGNKTLITNCADLAENKITYKVDQQNPLQIRIEEDFEMKTSANRN